MQEVLFVVAVFLGGWAMRGISDARSIRSRSRRLGKPEMMWFNEKKSRWDRVTHMHLRVADQAIIEIPVKLTEERREE